MSTSIRRAGPARCRVRSIVVPSLLVALAWLGGPSAGAADTDQAGVFSYFHEGQLVVLTPSPALVAVPSPPVAEGAARPVELPSGWSRDPRSDRAALRERGIALWRLAGAAPRSGADKSRTAAPETALARALRDGYAAQPVFELGGALKIPSDEVIVSFAGETTLEQAREFVARHGADLGLIAARPLRARTFVVTLRDAEGGRAYPVSRALSQLPGIAWAEPNHLLVFLGEQSSGGVPAPPNDTLPAPRNPRPLLGDAPRASAGAGPQTAANAPTWSTALVDGFETNTGTWQVTNKDGTTDADPVYTTARARSGSRSVYMTGGGSAGVSPPGPYPNNCDVYLWSPALDLSGAEEAYVEFWFWARFESPSIDPGSGQLTLYDYGRAWLYDPATQQSTGSAIALAYTGDLTADPTTANGWRRQLIRVPPAFRKSGVQVVFEFISDVSVTYEGLYIDDLRVVKSVDVDVEAISNDPYSARQYELHNVGQIAGLGNDDNDLEVPEAWAEVSVSPGIVVAVIDDGVDLLHPDLNLVTGYDGDTGAVGGGHRDAAAMHGTACAGNVGAIGNNALGVAGTAPGVKIMPIHNGGTEATLANAIDIAVAHGAHVLSNSWGWVGAPNAAITSAFQDALAAGRTVVIAAGNGPDRAPWTYETAFPCNLTSQYDVICVGASSPTDEHKNASSSDGIHSWGSSYVGAGPDVVAPGPWSYTTDRRGADGYNTDAAASGIHSDFDYQFGGTSSATPKVAGIAALLLSKNPSLTPAQVKSILKTTAHDIDAPGSDDRTGSGRVDALAAVRAAGGGGGNPVPTLATLVPSSAAAGGPAFTLTVTGTNFLTSSIVRWNGGDRATTYDSSTQLRAAITAADIAAAGSAAVTVFNPAPGGGTSSPLTFTITGGGGSVTTPTAPSGPATGTVGQSLTYTSGGATCSLGEAVEYQFVWGDGTNSAWAPPASTGGLAAALDAPPFDDRTPATAVERTVARDLERLLPRAAQGDQLRVIALFELPEALDAQLAPDESSARRARLGELQEEVLARLGATRAREHRRFRLVPGLALTVDETALRLLGAMPEVVSIEEDRWQPAALSGSVPLIGAPTAWTAGYTGAGQVVAILDTGVDRNHPFLAGKVILEACYSTNDPANEVVSACPNGQEQQVGTGAAAPCNAPSCDHGTHVAGIAAGKGTGFSGVAKEANLIAVQVFSLSGSNTGSFTSDQIAGLEFVFAQRLAYSIASVNISIGGGQYGSYCDGDFQAQKVAIDNLRAAGIATVIASGNNGYLDTMSAPACISSAVSVGSTTKQDVVSDFSNAASFLSLLAPGSDIYSSVTGGAYAYKSGTSMAAPHVAGAWAVLKSKKPTATVDEVLQALVNTGVDITDWRGNGLTRPRIRVDQAAASLSGGGGGNTATASHSWSSAGSFPVKVRARCAVTTGIVSADSPALDVTISSIGEPVTPPTVLTGPISRTQGESGSYQTDGATTNLGGPVQYLFDWADGTDSGWLPVGVTSASHAWSAPGVYGVRSKARSAWFPTYESGWSGTLAVTVIQPLEVVSTPSTPSGPLTGMVGALLAYQTGGSSSSYGHAVQYLFDWGDGSNSGWLPVGTTSASHAWSSFGVKSVYSKSRSSVNPAVESDWSSPLAVSIANPSGPDLVGSWTSLVQKCKKGVCTISGKFTVRNAGTMQSASAAVWFIASLDRELDEEDAYLASGSVKSLKPGKSAKVKLKYKLPAGLSAAGLFMLGWIDPLDLVAEMNEGNNISAGGPLR